MKHTVTRDRRRMLRADYAALGPYSLWALLFILVPLVFVAYYAFTDNNFQFTLENVQRFFTATSKYRPCPFQPDRKRDDGGQNQASAP